MQIVRPREVMDRLLATILTVQEYVTAAMAGVGLATLATAALVFLLSLQVRRREIETMVRMGCSRRRLFAVLTTEIAGVLVAGVVLAAALTALLSRLGHEAVGLLVELAR